MRMIHRRLYGKLVSSDLHSGRNLKNVVHLLSNHQEIIICRSKLQTMVCHRTKLYGHNTLFNVEEEDGYQMVRVRAPPGAAESSAPGHIEWEKTVGSRVTAGEVVCRIRFKEERTLDIKSPVTGMVAVRRKNEGDTVAHGDELFKVRLDASESLKVKKKKKTKDNKDYYEEEEEIVGRSAEIDKSGKLGGKSSFLGKTSVGESRGPENYRMELSKSEGKQMLPQQPIPVDDTVNTNERYRSDNLQSRVGLISNPYSQPIATPISQLMTTINEVNMEGTINFINKFAGMYEVKYGNKPCLRSIYIKAAAHALTLHKELNIKLVNDERVEAKELEITIAIRHLKVIVFHTVKNINKMSYVEISRLIFEIEKQIAAGTYKTQKGEIGFTVSPEWEIGSLVGTPAHSKTCTLGLHSIIKRPIFEEDKIIAYPMMYVSLTYDKKFIDDEIAINYLRTFKESIEDPRHILVQSP